MKIGNYLNVNQNSNLDFNSNGTRQKEPASPRPVRTMHRRGILRISLAIGVALVYLCVRLGDLMLVQSSHYQDLAYDLHTRERQLKAMRGEIQDRNGKVLAANRTVCTISLIHSQIKDTDAVVAALSDALDMDADAVRKKAEKITAREIVRTNVKKSVGDAIRELDLAGVKVDEDYKRYYPFGSLASKVLGFTGADNQGIIGLEVSYDEVLQGINGSILTYTDAAGIELENTAEQRVEPIAGNTLRLTLDWNIQSFVTQVCYEVMEEKQAKEVSCIVMNPQNGEIYAMANVPEFDLNHPFELPEGTYYENEQQRQDLLNQMWRNANVSDTYEPGSTFKTVTAAAALEAGVVTFQDTFSCPGFYIVEDRRIRCHKVSGHGGETFLQGIQNSCNPVFIQVGLRLGADRFYSYFEQFELLKKTGVDLPGEARTIMHDPAKIGEVELATISFGQSFQLTTLRLITTISSFINGGHTVVPHLGMAVMSFDGTSTQKIAYGDGTQVLDAAVSAQMRECLESVVAEGGGKKAYIEGYRIGGKTATSEKLPRGTGKYISSFVGFAPADNPQVIAIMTVDEPQGIYYGGTIVAPQVKKIFENILPYLDL